MKKCGAWRDSVSDEGLPGDEWVELVVEEIVIESTGTIYIQMERLNSVSVSPLFDDVEIETGQRSVEIIQTDDYYPFGLTFNSNTSVSSTSKNNYLYNDGAERQEELNIDFTAFRTYDPAIARWMQQDMIHKFHESPYAWVTNNPIRFNDPLGLDTISHVPGEYPIPGVSPIMPGGGSQPNLPILPSVQPKQPGSTPLSPFLPNIPVPGKQNDTPMLNEKRTVGSGRGVVYDVLYAIFESDWTDNTQTYFWSDGGRTGGTDPGFGARAREGDKIKYVDMSALGAFGASSQQFGKDLFGQKSIDYRNVVSVRLWNRMMGAAGGVGGSAEAWAELIQAHSNGVNGDTVNISGGEYFLRTSGTDTLFQRLSYKSIEIRGANNTFAPID